MRTLLSAVILLSFARSAAVADEPPMLPIGAAAPDFDLPGVDGRNHALKDFAPAKLLVVVFTANHCPTAQNYEERLKKIADDYRDRGVALVAISSNSPKGLRLNEQGYTDLGDSFEDMKLRAVERKFNFPYLYDGDTEAVGKAYGPKATPHVFVFDAERKLRYCGRVDDSEREARVKTRDLRDALDALLAGRGVPTPQTKVIGCSIKWAAKEPEVRQYMEKLAAEPVTVEKADGEALKALRTNASEKVRLINAWSIGCRPCVTEFPDLVVIDRMYRHRAFEFVSVSTDDPGDEAKVLAFLKERQASNGNLIFATPDKYPLVEALDKEWSGTMPFTLLLAPGGRVLYRQEGPVDLLALRRAIVAAIPEDRFR